MSRPARVASVEYLGDRLLRLVFTDGLVRELDFAGALPGVLAAVDDDVVFGAAGVDAVAGTLSWPIGVDLDPDVLHGGETASGAFAPSVVSEYRLQETS
ncbi:MAG: DUF2442 domain-containing protein [Acidimicrobiales bacterium]